MRLAAKAVRSGQKLIQITSYNVKAIVINNADTYEGIHNLVTSCAALLHTRNGSS
jgi:hypothetical protein